MSLIKNKSMKTFKEILLLYKAKAPINALGEDKQNWFILFHFNLWGFYGKTAFLRRAEKTLSKDLSMKSTEKGTKPVE